MTRNNGLMLASLSFYKKISFCCAFTVLIIGILVILGWIASIPTLTSLCDTWVPMKVNTAVGFLFMGCGILFLLQCERSSEKTTIYHQLARATALALFIIGGVTACEYAFGVDLHIDELLIKQPKTPSDASLAGRMSPFTSLIQINYAIAIWLLTTTKPKNWAAAQVCAFLGSTIGLLAIIGYLLNAKEFYAVGHYTAIAANTAVGFILVSLGMLFLEPNSGLMRTFTSQTKTGQILRRLVPAALLLPIFAGWLRLQGQYMGMFGLESGLAIIVTFSIVFCEAGLFWISRQFQQTELALSQREIKLQEQAELLNLTFDPIIVRDMNSKIIFWNTGAEQTYGYTQAEAIGKISHELLHTKFSVPLTKINSIVLEAGRWEGELTHYAKNGRSIIVATRWSLKKNKDGELPSVLEINNDITAAKEAEQRVSEFYSTVSHELRTPLTSMKGVFSLFAGGRAGELSERGKELITLGLTETERLIRLINNILDIKKIEAGKLELHIENINPDELIHQTVNSVSRFAEQYKVNLLVEIEDNDTIKGDRDRLMQILTNLISNAVKFSDEGQTVKIISARNGEFIRFSIVDTGPGIDSRNVPKLFRMFQQVESTDQAKGGTGLGLAICKSLVEQHSGSIGLKTVPGKGSTFWFEIPCLRYTVSL